MLRLSNSVRSILIRPNTPTGEPIGFSGLPFSALLLASIGFVMLLLLPGALQAQGESEPTRPGQTILTREDLQASGITRLHEIFLLLENWNGRTINGQDWSTTVGGLTTFDGAGPMVWIDGHPVSLSTPGWYSFNHLPVALLDVQKVIVMDTPGLYRGVFTDRGAIEIITERDSDGWVGEVRLAAGNEINDPGPYEFTPLNSPNEERLGPDGDLILGYHGERWYAETSGSVMRHRSTDTPIEQRIKQMLFIGDATFKDPTNLKWTGQFRSGFETESTRVNVRAGGLHHRDFPFLERLGREIPVVLKSVYGGIDLERSITDHTSVELRTTWQRLRPDYLENRAEFDFDLKQSERSWQAELRRDREHRRWSAGWRLDELSVSGEFSETFHPLHIATFYGEWSESVAEHLWLTAQLTVSRSGDDDPGQSISLRSDWTVRPGQNLRSWISYSERPEWQQRDLWFWMEKGYEALTLPDIPFEQAPGREASRLSSAGLEWSLNRSERTSLTLHGALFHHRNLSIASHRFRIVRPYQWFEHDGTEFHADQTLTRLRFGLNLRLELRPGLTQTIAGTLLMQPGRRSGDVIEGSFGEHPAHTFRTGLYWTPVRSFELWGLLRATSSVQWPDFDLVDGELYMDQQELDQGGYSSRTGPALNLDTGGRKWLWRDRLSLDLMIKNLFNRSNFLYPVGADQELTFYIQLGLRL